MVLFFQIYFFSGTPSPIYNGYNHQPPLALSTQNLGSGYVAEHFRSSNFAFPQVLPLGLELGLVLSPLRDTPSAVVWPD